MARKILVLNGHPDPRPQRLCAALADAYAAGAGAAGHQVRRIDVGALEFPLIRSFDDFTASPPPPAVREVQDALLWADHLVIVHPLWLGGAPALLKALLEQVFRYGFALPRPDEAARGFPAGRLKGRSARVVVTMGMPALVFRLAFGAHGLRAVTRGVLWISGFRPIRHTLLGGVEGPPAKRDAWLAQMKNLGRRAV